MGRAHSARVRDREGELDRRVRRERVDAPAREEILGALRAAEDLEEDRGAGRGERRAIHEELRAVERHRQAQRIVDALRDRLAGRGSMVQGHKGRFGERGRAVHLGRGGLSQGRAHIAEDRRVDTPGEVGGAAAGERADPVVADGLVGGEDERVALAGEDPDGVDRERLVVDGVGLNDGHVVAVDGELEVRVARHRDEAEAVALALGDGDDSEFGRGATGVPAKSIDEDRVGTKPALPLVYGSRQYWERTHRILVLILVAVWYQSARVMMVDSASPSVRGQGMGVEEDLTIVNVIQIRMRVVRVVHNHGSAQAITILSGQMAVVPERARLVETGELVGERVACGDRALVHKRGAILPVGTYLVHTVEMLNGGTFQLRHTKHDV